MIMIDHGLDFDISKVPSPCFVLDQRRLLKNLQLLQHISTASGAGILCAFKGFAMWSTFPMLRQYLSGATASSLHEAMLCQEFFNTKAHLCCPVYLLDEIDQITNLASHITFNSLSQFERYEKIASDKGLKIGLRINPEYSEVETDLYNPCIPGSRLGITLQNMPKKLPKSITGLHFHVMCEQNADTLARTLQQVEEKFGEYLCDIQWLNIGGGHHFTRQGYDIELFIETIRNFQKKYQLKIIAEPGEAIGWETGYLISTIQDIVCANGIYTAMLDTSFAAHMPDCLEMPYQPTVLGSVSKQKNAYAYRLGGTTCLAGDFMGFYHFSKPLKPGDRIVFDDMIHYTMVKTNTFNGVNLPAIGSVDLQGNFTLLKTFGYPDYKERLS